MTSLWHHWNDGSAEFGEKNPHGWADFSSHVWLTWPNQESQETSAWRFQPHSTASAETKPSKLFMTLLDYSKDDSLDTHGIPTICESGWVRYSFLESFRHSYIMLYQSKPNNMWVSRFD